MSKLYAQSSVKSNNHPHNPHCKCEITDNNTIKCEEKGRVFYLENANGEMVEKITVDGCYYTKGGNELRCDYVLNHQSTMQGATQSVTIFVELKGTDLEHATNQILATNESEKIQINQNKFAAIILSRNQYPRNNLLKSKMINKLAGKNILCDNHKKAHLIKNVQLTTSLQDFKKT
jgi:hypothetical protein